MAQRKKLKNLKRTLDIILRKWYNVNRVKGKGETEKMNNAKIFLDLDGTLAKFNVPNALKRFKTEERLFC